MRTEEARPVRLEDYRPPDWLVETVELDVSLDPRATRVRATLELKPNGTGGAPARLTLDGDGLSLVALKLDGAALRARALCRDAGPADHRAAAAASVSAGDRDGGRSLGQHAAVGPLSFGIDLLHPMRGRGLPPHHLFPRPARRDGGLHDPHRGRERRGAGAARQRQPDGRGRRARNEPAFRGLARSVPQALLSVRAGRRRARPASRTASAPCRGATSRCASTSSPARRTAAATRWTSLKRAMRWDEDALRPRIRSRYLHDRRGLRLQHGRDGEQGPQRLQRQIRAGLARRPRPTPTSTASRRSSRTNISTTGPATASPAATGSSYA